MATLTAGAVLLVRLRAQVEALATADDAIRSGDQAGVEVGVHDARVACRRMSAALATFRPLVLADDGAALREDLRWLARSLGSARDEDVARERLLTLVADQPEDEAARRFLERLRADAWSGDAGEDLGEQVLGAQRYADLRARLDRFVAEPPWTARSDQEAGEFLLARLRREWRGLARRAVVVTDAADGAASDDALHDVRKTAKRMRYALEVAELVWPRKPTRLRRRVHHLTDLLGEHQDTVLTRVALGRLADQALAAGEPTVVEERLGLAEERRAAELEAEFRVEWAAAESSRVSWP